MRASLPTSSEPRAGRWPGPLRSIRPLGLAVAGLALAAAVAAQPPAGTPPIVSIPGLPSAPAAAPPAADRVQFEFKLPADQGGGSVTGSAGALETEGETKAILSGKVELKYRDMVIRAERLVLLRAEQRVLAEGGVVLDQGPRRLSGETLDYNLETRTGALTADLLVAARLGGDPGVLRVVHVGQGPNVYEKIR